MECKGQRYASINSFSKNLKNIRGLDWKRKNGFMTGNIWREE
jgi:hypothetical protein